MRNGGSAHLCEKGKKYVSCNSWADATQTQTAAAPCWKSHQAIHSLRKTDTKKEEILGPIASATSRVAEWMLPCGHNE
jgi:hypothetical protein